MLDPEQLPLDWEDSLTKLEELGQACTPTPEPDSYLDELAKDIPFLRRREPQIQSDRLTRPKAGGQCLHPRMQPGVERDYCPDCKRSFAVW